MSNVQTAWLAWLTTAQERVIAHDNSVSNTHFPSALDVPPNHRSLHGMSLLRLNESACSSKL